MRRAAVANGRSERLGEPVRRSQADVELLAAQGWVAHPPAERQAALLVSYVDANGLCEAAAQLVALPPEPPVEPIRNE